MIICVMTLAVWRSGVVCLLFDSCSSLLPLNDHYSVIKRLIKVLSVHEDFRSQEDPQEGTTLLNSNYHFCFMFYEKTGLSTGNNLQNVQLFYIFLFLIHLDLEILQNCLLLHLIAGVKGSCMKCMTVDYQYMNISLFFDSVKNSRTNYTMDPLI